MPLNPLSNDLRISRNERFYTTYTLLLLHIWIPATDLGAQREVDRDIPSQSRSQQFVGRSVQTTISDLGNLIADLESNGLLEDTMVAKMRSAQEVLNSIGKDSIPEATAKLDASAALSAVGRTENPTQATNEIDSILMS